MTELTSHGAAGLPGAPPAPKPKEPPVIIQVHRKEGLGTVIRYPVNLQLKYSGIWHAYEVVSITSTVIYRPGEHLAPVVVDECCQQKGWSVTMVHDDWLMQLLSSIISLPKFALPAVIP